MEPPRYHHLNGVTWFGVRRSGPPVCVARNKSWKLLLLTLTRASACFGFHRLSSLGALCAVVSLNLLPAGGLAWFPSARGGSGGEGGFPASLPGVLAPVWDFVCFAFGGIAPRKGFG